MSQASDELRARWHDDWKACGFLSKRGYKLTEDWGWKKPSPSHQPTEEEQSAVLYLIMEWDYCGIRD